MIRRWIRTCWWLILMLVPLGAGVVLGASSNRQVQRAAILLMVYSVAVAYVWLRMHLALRTPTLRTLRIAFPSWRSFVVDHLPFVIRGK
jgi:FtsH-binding integral membrane protein